MSEIKKPLGEDVIPLARLPDLPAPHLLPTEREAARLLSRIIERLSVQTHQADRIVFTFDADVEFHDRLCVWGADSEDLEDDTPLEDDECEMG